MSQSSHTQPGHILITGATGFLGRYVVRAALAAGHRVTATYRSEDSRTGSGLAGLQGLSWVRVDLQNPEQIDAALAGIDTVIHLAARMAGGATAMRGDTVDATRQLIQAMGRSRVGRLVLVSSLAVYDYQAPAEHATLDETTPLEPEPGQRDVYCAVKLEQEALARSLCEAMGIGLTVLRPGAIIGPGHVWTSRIGVGLPAGFWLMIGGHAPLPLTYVGNCAEAIVLGVGPAAVGQTLNIIDDDQPTQREFLKQLLGAGGSPPRTVTLPWPVVRAVVGAVSRVNSGLCGGRLPLPGIVSPRRLAARVKPMNYSNARIKQALGWTPRVPVRDAIRLSLASGETNASSAPPTVPDTN